MSEENNMTEQEQIVLGGRTEEIVKCANCEKELTVAERNAFEGEDGKDVYFCDECLAQINSELEEETKNPNIVGAVAVGTITGVVGAAIWYWFTVLTNYQLGYLAIGLGWLVAMGVSFGAGRKKGGRIQFISVCITLIALFAAEFMIGLHYIAATPEYNTTALGLFNSIVAEGALDFVATFIGVVIGSTSPIGLVIWGIALYAAFIVPKARKLV